MSKLNKLAHGAGGFIFKAVSEGGNCKLGQEKTESILKALKNSDTQGVYQRTDKKIVQQMMNGNTNIMF